MCGIAGVAFAASRQAPDGALLNAMASSLQHRGPDDLSTYCAPGCGLAMSRLAVIDVANGQQPICNEDGTVVAVFNGEIYNFRELAADLVHDGHRLRSNSDSEVIVHLYERHGIEFAKKLHGMFAIALWDANHSRLVLTRDRIGVKPLYYHVISDRLAFASEIKSLLQDETIPRDADLIAIDHLIRFGHFSSERSAFAGIGELAPATTLCFESGRIRQQTYWDFASHVESSAQHRSHFDRRGSVTDLQTAMTTAVTERLTSDVPLGAFLSGGIDSSVVAMLMSRQLDKPFDTFSIGFDDADFDERPYARAVAKLCGSRHHEFVVQPDVESILPTLIRHHDAPFYDTSAIPTYYLCKLAKEHVTVALSGDGGDELFAGYNIFIANQAASLYQRVPRLLRDPLFRWLAAVVPESSSYFNHGRVLREFVNAAPMQPIERYARWNAKVKFEARDKLYRHEQLRDCLSTSNASFLSDDYCQFEHATELDRLLYIAMRNELACDMLVKVDRMSMAHGLEVRSPLLSHSLFEFAATLPDRAKVRRFQGKCLLREFAERILPKKIVRRRKRGFSIPLDRWLRTSLADFSRGILLDRRTHRRGLFQTETVETFLKQHASGEISRGREIWTMLTIEMWHRMYIDQKPVIETEATPVEITSASVST